MQLSVLDTIGTQIDRLRVRLACVDSEVVDHRDAVGRVLASDLLAFRDSPAIDVSAMDGYAFHLSECLNPNGPIEVVGTACAGAPPIVCPIGKAVRIFTGAPVPSSADCVVPREQCLESPHSVTVQTPRTQLQPGQNIRRRAENAKRGDVVLPKGTLVSDARVASAVTFSSSHQFMVHRKLRVAILNTGDELVSIGNPLELWQIRDSNGPLLDAFLSKHAWIQSTRSQVRDDPSDLRAALRSALINADAVLLTGGVSMGDTDHVPKTILDCGGEIAFHRLPIRPGKPVLGAIGPQRQLIMGLPGNPMSVAVTYRRFCLPLLRKLAGFQVTETPAIRIPVQCSDAKTLPLLWFRLVSLDPSGVATVNANQGSGDVAAMGQSDGFVEIPPGTPAQGMFPFYSW